MLKKKQQLVLCWRVGICNSEKRAKKEAANKTLPIWQYFTKNKKADSPTKQNRHNKRDQAVRRAAKRLHNQRVFTLFPIAAANQLTSCPPTLQPLQHPNVEQPSVLNHFDQNPNHNPPPDSPPSVRRISDRFPDGWIE